MKRESKNINSSEKFKEVSMKGKGTWKVWKMLFLILVTVFILTGGVQAFELPDAQQITCYDGAGNTIMCPPEYDPLAQDGTYVLNPLSFNDNGDGTVSDYNTGLMWEKADSVTPHSWSEAISECESATTAFYTDWRLPTKKEIVSLINYENSGSAGSALDSSLTYPGMVRYLWSADTSAQNSVEAWFVDIFTGVFDIRDKSFYSHPVRCVRETQLSYDDLVDNANGTVTSNSTGHSWQQGTGGAMSWESALSYCESLALGGYSDWRLPNIKELESILNETYI